MPTLLLYLALGLALGESGLSRHRACTIPLSQELPGATRIFDVVFLSVMRQVSRAGRLAGWLDPDS